MKKIILTEEQSKKLVDRLINEQSRSWRDLLNDDGRMHVEVDCSFYYHRATFKGGEIDSVSNNKMSVSFLLEPEWRSYGIKSISVYDIKGPEAVELWIEYFVEGKEDPEETTFDLKLDWENMLQTEDDESLGWFGISDDIEIELGNDPQGGLIATSINVGIRGF